MTRDRQFVGNPVQPPATRQSYQDSDIFGTKKGTEVVQRAATADKNSFRQRAQNTYARSNVLGNDVAANKLNDGDIHHAITTRQENQWKSKVFAGPAPDQTNRKNLARNDAGRGGLYGDDEGSSTW